MKCCPSIDQGSSEDVSIEGIDLHLTADALSTHDPLSIH